MSTNKLSKKVNENKRFKNELLNSETLALNEKIEKINKTKIKWDLYYYLINVINKIIHDELANIKNKSEKYKLQRVLKKINEIFEDKEDELLSFNKYDFKYPNVWKFFFKFPKFEFSYKFLEGILYKKELRDFLCCFQSLHWVKFFTRWKIIEVWATPLFINNMSVTKIKVEIIDEREKDLFKRFLNYVWVKIKEPKLTINAFIPARLWWLLKYHFLKETIIYLKWKISWWSDQWYYFINTFFPEIYFSKSDFYEENNIPFEIKYEDLKHLTERKYKITWISENSLRYVLNLFLPKILKSKEIDFDNNEIVFENEIDWKLIKQLDFLNSFNLIEDLKVYYLDLVLRFIHKNNIKQKTLESIYKRIEIDKIFLFMLSSKIKTKLSNEKYFKEQILNFKNYIIEENNKKNKLDNEKLAIEMKNYVEELENILYEKKWFKLTNAQKKVIINYINNKYSKLEYINSIIQWDVWSWKTLVAFFLILLYNKFYWKQIFFLSPINLLIKQHYQNFIEIFWEYLNKNNIKYELLTWDVTQSRKNKIYEDITNNDLKIVFWTQAILADKVIPKDLWLIMYDEQHKFWVNQRSKFEETTNCSTINFTATPISRSILLSTLGISDIEYIDEFPFWEKKIKTDIFYDNDFFLKEKEEIQKIENEIINNWKKMFVLANKVDETIKEKEEKKQKWKKEIKLSRYSLNDAKKLILNNFTKIKEDEIWILHWRLKDKEKDEIIEKYKKWEIKILITTTVIEVWIDIPNSNYMIILNADHLWLLQLHQLRWRIWRDWQQSYCYMLVWYWETTENNKQNLENWLWIWNWEWLKDDIRYKKIKILKETLNWLEISKYDSEIRWVWELLKEVDIQQSWKNDISFEIFTWKELEEIEKIVNKKFKEIIKNYKKYDIEIENKILFTKDLYKDIKKYLNDNNLFLYYLSRKISKKLN